ncbi:MAG: transposase [Rhodobacteraceae bacterium]|nr:transposase [Paracoccaceae bacterium]
MNRRADVVGKLPNEATILRLIGSVRFEQNDERQISSRCMMAEAFAQFAKDAIEPILSIATIAF